MFKNLNKQVWLKPFLIGSVSALIINYIIISIFLPVKFNSLEDKNNLVLVNVANAAEIYPEFLCTCCGKQLDPDNICCGMMKGMIDYIDGQIDNKLSKDEIMMDTILEKYKGDQVTKNMAKGWKEKYGALIKSNSDIMEAVFPIKGRPTAFNISDEIYL